MLEKPSFAEVFAIERAKLCPELNGSFTPDMLSGQLLNRPRSVEFIWSEECLGDDLVDLRRSFQNGLHEWTRVKDMPDTRIIPAIGHFAIRPHMPRNVFISHLQQNASFEVAASLTEPIIG